MVFVSDFCDAKSCESVSTVLHCQSIFIVNDEFTVFRRLHL